MITLLEDKKFAIRCDCCKTLFDGHDACQPDTTGESADEAQEAASNYDFFCCNPLHICENCQRKIHERKVSVEFHAGSKTSVDDALKNVKTSITETVDKIKSMHGLLCLLDAYKLARRDGNAQQTGTVRSLIRQQYHIEVED